MVFKNDNQRKAVMANLNNGASSRQNNSQSTLHKIRKQKFQTFPTSFDFPTSFVNQNEKFRSDIEKPKHVRYPFTREELKIAKNVSGTYERGQGLYKDSSCKFGICPALAVETFKRLGNKGKIVCGVVSDVRRRGFLKKNKDYNEHCWVEHDGKVYDFNNLSFSHISYRISKIDRHFYQPNFEASSIDEFYKKLENTDLLPPRKTKLMVARLDKKFGVNAS